MKLIPFVICVPPFPDFGAFTLTALPAKAGLNGSGGSRLSPGKRCGGTACVQAVSHDVG
jgi:hypothetical protein